jgi:hypothetical protein
LASPEATTLLLSYLAFSIHLKKAVFATEEEYTMVSFEELNVILLLIFQFILFLT